MTHFSTKIVLIRPDSVLETVEFNGFSLHVGQFEENHCGFSKATILARLNTFLVFERFSVPAGFMVEICEKSEIIDLPKFLQGILVILKGSEKSFVYYGYLL